MIPTCAPSQVCGNCEGERKRTYTHDDMEGVSKWPPNDDSSPSAKSPQVKKPQQQSGMNHSQSPRPPAAQGPSTVAKPPAATPQGLPPQPQKLQPEHQPQKVQKEPEPKPLWNTMMLDEENMLRDSNWCLYCCCAGIANSCDELRLVQCALQILCCRQVCHGAQCQGEDSGPCKVISDCVCCTTICQAPMKPGRPYCVLGNKPCCGVYGGGFGSTRPMPGEDKKDIDFDKALDGGCVPCFCCCCGLVLGLTAFSQHVWKCGCCEMKHKTPGGFQLCGSVCSAGCCLYQCRLPCFESPPSPVCAVCGWRCRGGAAPSSSAPPKQQNMY